MNCRKNVSRMTNTEKTDYVDAVVALKGTAITEMDQPDAWADGVRNRYDMYVWIHLQVMNGAHRGSAFLPWHREFLRQFELELQAVSGNPKLTIPYWDWIEYKQTADNSPDAEGVGAGFPFTSNLMGGMGTGADNRVETGAFAESSGWVLNIITGSDSGNARDNTPYLRRENGQNPNSLPNASTQDACLSTNVYDQAPFQEPNYGAGGISGAEWDEIDASFRKKLEWGLHNSPHIWVGGNMRPMTSPNDPVFFLHHCNVDKIWAVWSHINPTGFSNYQPAAGTPNHSLNTSMLMLDQTFFNYPAKDTPNELLDHRDLGYMYDTDLPVVNPSAMSINFGQVPENTVTYGWVEFTIETCRKVTFRITAAGGNAAFQIPDLVTPYEVEVEHNNGEPQTIKVFVKLHATTGTGVKNGMVTISAIIDDEEGYYAGSPGEYTADSWDINLTANVQEREKSAVCLVLDKSFSMTNTDGTSLSRFEMLETAVDVVRDIMLPDDGIGMVYYDTNENRLFGITQMSAGGSTNVTNAINNAALNPSGNTAIGKGMIEGADVLGDEISLAGTPYDNFAMLVMSDGNQNVQPYVGTPAVNTAITDISADVYAVGLGSQGSVNDDVLGDIAEYQLITGTMASDERLFLLTHYFVQILADVSNNDIVVDPIGRLFFDLKHEVEYHINEADMYADVIILSPFAPLITASIITPGGDVIQGSNGNAQHMVNANDQLYRISMPALPASATGSHAGKWKVVLELSAESVREAWKEIAENNQDLLKKLSQYQSVPYSVIVQAYSDLNFEMAVDQSSKVAGAKINITATLSQYNVAVEGDVKAKITYPNGKQKVIPLTAEGDGSYTSSFTGEHSGLYQIRCKAKGKSFAGSTFTREAVRTVSLYRSQPIPPVNDEEGKESGEALCKIVDCFLSDKGIMTLLKKHEVDARRLRECLKKQCMDQEQKDKQGANKVIAQEKATESKRLSQQKNELSTTEIDQLIATAPEMKAVAPHKPHIPHHSLEHLQMSVPPAIRFDKNGNFELIDFEQEKKKGKKKK
ncbi:tyrosinase family protein [Catalinimonas niigatensis]|uniref:tyrosinase family protein n=1 Tax=Catalinimonas niigatensis TaxID=1397264 RepID=UPI0026668844|nr:tyrosinase family protein [Catalinimonas niigatensis]WPP49290.1 tyrosinase family protein [Catalinimonas niigatensis]